MTGQFREMMLTMTIALAWVAATGGVLATIGTWTGPLRARWQLRAETIRNGQDRRENQLHRQRLAEVWHQWHDLLLSAYLSGHRSMINGNALP